MSLLLLLWQTLTLIRYYGAAQLSIMRTLQSRRPSWTDMPQVFRTYLPISNIPRVFFALALICYFSKHFDIVGAFLVSLTHLIQETRLCFRLLAHQGREEWAIGWGNVALFDHTSKMLTGQFTVPLWENDRYCTEGLSMCCNCLHLTTRFSIIQTFPDGSLRTKLQ